MKSGMMLSASLATMMVVGGATAALAAPSDELVAAAKKEGELTVITLPHDWCDYGEVIEAFKAKYGIKINELNPEGSSADEIEAVKANKGNKGPQAPDVLDIGLSFGPTAKADGLIQPYKVSTWDDIPADAKDADGFWYGDYYGVMSFAVNKDIIKTTPTDWADLLKPEYKGSVSLPGDPRGANEAIQAVYAAGLSRTNTPTEAARNGEEGLKFFADLNKSGNFVPVTGKKAQLAQGTTPIIIRWTFNNLDHRDSLKGNPPVDVVIPKTGVVAGVYVQAISAYAPHPNAAKLWEEFLYSDEGQTMWLKGYCNPIRFAAMQKAGKIPADLLKKLPPAEDFAKAVFPTLEQQAAGKEVIAKQWDKVVGATVK